MESYVSPYLDAPPSLAPQRLPFPMAHLKAGLGAGIYTETRTNYYIK